ncbi:polysaccharide pyruvyl transferase family protein [Cryobacterium sp. TMT1-3]|uniref:polysaccharide pyruvyl transferase family protein n=1 Tax=Cryobacterium sp. TMT1-3 TaxID=1259237 RepID=UPI001A7E07BB|nr:polysaccharide pyruvyl transferase family protein [Cryobacterium sp. TMT1-3]
MNTGDIAIGLASAQALNDRGIGSQVVDPFHPKFPRQLIVGGGDLIRVKGDPYYDLFRPHGQNILNAAGVWSEADDLGYLTDYAFVSARTNREAEYLRKWVPEAAVVPCTTTVLRSDHFSIPGITPGEPVIGIQLVPHSMRLIEDLVPIINAIPHKKVFIPFTHYNADASFMKSLPFDRDNCIFLDRLSALELHSVVGQMTQVLASSLHISIFAYSQNVPFVSIHQEKINNYFDDRGLDEHVVQTSSGLRQMLERLNMETFDFRDGIDADRASVERAFDLYADWLSTDDGGTLKMGPSIPPDVRRENLRHSQSSDVVADRDNAIGLVEGRRLSALARQTAQSTENERLADEIDRLADEVDDLRGENEILQHTWNQRLARLLRNPLQTVRNGISARRAR